MSEQAIQFWLEFLGWSTVINSGFLLFATFALVVFRPSIQSLHSRLVSVPSDELPALYFSYLGNYKLLIIVFNLVPYLVLRVISVG